MLVLVPLSTAAALASMYGLLARVRRPSVPVGAGSGKSGGKQRKADSASSHAGRALLEAG